MIPLGVGEQSPALILRASLVDLPNSRGSYAGLVAPGTQDKVSAPGFTEKPCFQHAEQGAP